VIALGPFELLAPIGRGGMGEVWEGLHRERDLPVAVKVLTAEGARDERFLGPFRNEVRAVAGLDHPNIVVVFDHGEITAAAAAASDGRLQPGSPYLVMEWASGGTLAERAPLSGWSELRRVLLCLLDALAHAHARGVVHRDLKPANVLLPGETDLRPGLKLADFGLASPREPTHGVLVAGTPSYMAPEQSAGRARDQGPWTDLYALGCVVYKLCTGSPPFASASVAEVARMHLRDEPPPLASRVPIPRGFEEWTRRLLEKRIERRFRHAADAAWALLELGAPHPPIVERAGEVAAAREDTAPVAPIAGLTDEPVSFTWPEAVTREEFAGALLTTDPVARTAETVVPEETGPITRAGAGLFYAGVGTDAATGTESSSGSRTGTGGASASSAGAATVPGRTAGPVRGGAAAQARRWRPHRPPLPSTWRRPEPPVPSLRLAGAGLGLYGLRAIPLVDRAPERDALWAALRGVHADARARLVTLVGPAGCGKSRLAAWLGERAHEVGAVTMLKAVHSPVAAPTEGLGPMAARFLGCVGLPRAETLLHVMARLRDQGVSDDDEWRALTELVAPGVDGGGPAAAPFVRFGSPTERYVLVRRLVERVAAERPVLLWLDDVQWGLDALRFAAHLLDAQQGAPSPVLIVLTAREEALPERPAEAALLAAIAARPSAERIEVGPLGVDDRSLLVRELLGLTGDLAALVEERTAGNPLFAVQLVEDWVDRAILEPAGHGFRLKAGARADLPDDLHEVWSARLARVLDGRPPGEGHSLELAAVLGRVVDGPEWSDVCARAGAIASFPLVETLIAQRLARCGTLGPTAGWSFIHGMLRESLERRAREAGRLEAHHRACARLLEGKRGVGVAERLGRHLLAAGEHEAALAPLLEGARERTGMGDYRIGEALLAERERALNELALPASDPRWGEGWTVQAQCIVMQGRVSEASRRAALAVRHARRYGWERVHALALYERGRVAWDRGLLERTERCMRDVAERARAMGDLLLAANARRSVAAVMVARGHLEPAAALFRAAHEDFDAQGDESGAGHCCMGLGVIDAQRGRLGEARAQLERALVHFERCGSRAGIALSKKHLADVARHRGALDEAEAGYRDALTLHEAIGSADAAVTEATLGLVLMERGQHADARRVLEHCLRTFEEHGRTALAGCTHACLLPGAADAGDWADFDAHLADARALLAQTGFNYLDIARAAQLGGDLARAAGEPARARGAYALAAAQWRALGRAGDAADAEAAAALLAPPPA